MLFFILLSYLSISADSRGNVAIIGNTILNVSNVVQVKRSENLQYSIHDITTNCELSSKYVIRWKFFSFGLNASSEPSQIATGNTALNLNTDNTQLSVSCCFLSYGYSTAIVTLEMTGLHTSAFRYTRKWDLLVDETPLMAVIAGGSYVEFDFGFPVSNDSLFNTQKIGKREMFIFVARV